MMRFNTKILIGTHSPVRIGLNKISDPILGDIHIKVVGLKPSLRMGNFILNTPTIRTIFQTQTILPYGLRPLRWLNRPPGMRYARSGRVKIISEVSLTFFIRSKIFSVSQAALTPRMAASTCQPISTESDRVSTRVIFASSTCSAAVLAEL